MACIDCCSYCHPSPQGMPDCPAPTRHWTACLLCGSSLLRFPRRCQGSARVNAASRFQRSRSYETPHSDLNAAGRELDNGATKKTLSGVLLCDVRMVWIRKLFRAWRALTPGRRLDQCGATRQRRAGELAQVTRCLEGCFRQGVNLRLPRSKAVRVVPG